MAPTANSDYLPKQNEEEEEVGGASERHCIGGEVRNYTSDFEGSQAVSACPSGIGRAYNRFHYILYIFTTLEGVHNSKHFC
jgi:hypothetical protein